MQMTIMPRMDSTIGYVDDMLLDENGRIKLFPASFYHALPLDAFRAWCSQRARYGIPTEELVCWLKARIAGRKAIEVAAGNGDLGYHLGILQTDSYGQTKDLAASLFYKAFQQVPTRPLSDVIQMDAERAVQVHKPDVVIASWLTRKFIKGKDIDGEAQASMYGPEEEKILKGCAEYIHIGNLNVHDQKTLLALPHETYHFPWIVSRAADQSLNVIHVWKNPYYPNGTRKK